MSFSLKPDYEKSAERYAAFWNREIIDRPPVSIILPVEKTKPVPVKSYKTLREKWLDIDFRAEVTSIEMSNFNYYADALPIMFPNFGPEIFSVWSGCGYNFGETTTWSEPCIKDWSTDADKATFNREHPLFKLLIDYTNRLLEYGKGNFIVGLTDFHPGGDHLAALRDPQELAFDMYDNVDEVKAKLKSSLKEYFEAYDIFYNILHAAGMPSTSWLKLIDDGKYYIPSNDFACMISKQMFDDVFLPGLIEECDFYNRSIYHLDGPGALKHLDSLLEIKKLDAIQWVPGAGNGGFEDWIHVYKKIQAAGKGIELHTVSLKTLPLVFEHLKPEGVWFSGIEGVNDKETADQVLKRITAWR